MDAELYLAHFDIGQQEVIEVGEDPLYTLLQTACLADLDSQDVMNFVSASFQSAHQVLSELEEDAKGSEIGAAYLTTRFRSKSGISPESLDAFRQSMDYEASINRMYFAMNLFSVATLSGLLDKLPSGARMENDESKITSALNEQLGHRSAQLARIVASCVTTITYQGTVARQNYRETGILTETVIHRHGFNEEKTDVETLEEFEEHAASKLLEIDAFVGLIEWVRTRGLPYIPIIAPPTTEDGDQLWIGGKNAHADILLVGVGNGDICPIQLKRKHLGEIEDSYIDDMVFLSDSDIAGHTEKVVILQGERAYTGHETKTIYGDISRSWIKFHGAKKGAKQKLRKPFQRSLEHSFDRFDARILPHLSM